jgi:hypothetical protein
VALYVKFYSAGVVTRDRRIGSQVTDAGVVVVNSKVFGLRPGVNVMNTIFHYFDHFWK